MVSREFWVQSALRRQRRFGTDSRNSLDYRVYLSLIFIGNADNKRDLSNPQDMNALNAKANLGRKILLNAQKADPQDGSANASYFRVRSNAYLVVVYFSNHQSPDSLLRSQSIRLSISPSGIGYSKTR